MNIVVQRANTREAEDIAQFVIPPAKAERRRDADFTDYTVLVARSHNEAPYDARKDLVKSSEGFQSSSGTNSEGY